MRSASALVRFRAHQMKGMMMPVMQMQFSMAAIGLGSGKVKNNVCLFLVCHRLMNINHKKSRCVTKVIAQQFFTKYIRQKNCSKSLLRN